VACSARGGPGRCREVALGSDPRAGRARGEIVNPLGGGPAAKAREICVGDIGFR
jgi:hypothetical protein